MLNESKLSSSALACELALFHDMYCDCPRCRFPEDCRVPMKIVMNALQLANVSVGKDAEAAGASLVRRWCHNLVRRNLFMELTRGMRPSF